MASDVKVTIKKKPVAGKLGFGYPLILAAKETGKGVAYTECTSVDEVVKAGFTVESKVYKAAQLLFMQEGAPAKIAVCATLENTVAALPTIYSKGWRQLVSVNAVAAAQESSDSTLVEIATYMEAKGDRMYFATVGSYEEDLPQGMDRTVLFYHTTDNAVAALVGATAGKKPGSFTYKNQILKGIDPLALDEGALTALQEANCMSFLTKAGDNVTSEGKSSSGEYIDIVDSKDYVISNIEYQTQKVLNQSEKVPYTNVGIAMLESVCINVLQDAFNNGIIATTESGTPDYTVSYALREETQAADRAVRKYIGGKFKFTMAGAIHEAEINGEIEI